MVHFLTGLFVTLALLTIGNMVEGNQATALFGSGACGFMAMIISWNYGQPRK